jgi:hypothetical protein
MGKGPGRIERAIQAAFAVEPDNAFTTEELCQRIYRGTNQAEKKHRVAVLRAATRSADRARNDPAVRPGIGSLVMERLGGQSVFFDRYSVLSYGMARLKAEHYANHRDRRWRPPHWHKSEAECREMLASSKYRPYTYPEGAWWWHVRRWIAERDGEAQTIAAAKLWDNKTRALLGLPREP